MSWPLAKMSDTYLGLYDGPHGTPRPSDEGRVFLGIGNITDDGHLDLSSARRIADDQFAQWTRRVTPRPKDIVFTYEATLNRYAIVPNGFDGCLGRRVALIRPNPDVADYRFLFYSFFSREWRETIERNRLSGATVDRVPLSLFPNFPIRLPSLPTQHRIADILSAYDDLIENNTRRIAILEDIARRLFEEWFNRPTFEELPHGWVVQPLRNILKLHYGKALKADIRIEGLVPVYGSSGAVGSHNVPLVSGPGIILGRKGNVGSVFYSPCDFYPIDTVFYVETDLSLHFVYQLLRQQSFSNSDSAVPGLNRELALSKEVQLPPTDLIERYGVWVAPVVAEAQALRDANTNLRTTRDLLLPKLISGEIEVCAAEAELETATA